MEKRGEGGGIERGGEGVKAKEVGRGRQRSEFCFSELCELLPL